MIDDTQADWEQRISVGHALSGSLPLQIVLRIPFKSTYSLSQLFPRCVILYIATSQLQPPSSDPGSVTHYEKFAKIPVDYRNLCEESTAIFKQVSNRGFPIILEGINDVCFGNSISSSDTQKGERIEEKIAKMSTQMITKLAIDDNFEGSGSESLNIWPHLPLLPFLRHLELSGGRIPIDRSLGIPKVCLPNLYTLQIKYVPSPSGLHAQWSIFSLLGCLKSPSLQFLNLSGSFGALLPALERSKRLRVPNITVCLTSFGGLHKSTSILSTIKELDRGDFASRKSTSMAPVGKKRDQEPSWHWLACLGIEISLEVSMYIHHGNLRGKPNILDALILRAPPGCLIRLKGGERAQDDILHLFQVPDIDCLKYSKHDSVEFQVEYRKGGPTSNKSTGGRNIRSIIFDCVPAKGTLPPCSPNHITINEVAYVDRLIKTRSLHPVWPDQVQILDLGECSIDSTSLGTLYPMQSTIVFVPRGLPLIVTSLRCAPNVADEMMTNFGLPRLETLTLTLPLEEQDPLPSKLIKQRRTLKALIVLRLESIPSSWDGVIHLLVAFNRDRERGGGISRIELPGLPHPSILRGIIQALGGKLDDYFTFSAQRESRSHLRGTKTGCQSCSQSGWACFDGALCTRFSKTNMVSITKDMLI